MEETAPEPVGAVEELARDDVQRKHFLKIVGKGVGAAGAAGAFGAFLAACGSSSSSSKKAAPATTTTAASASPAGDIAILNYALTLEYLETEFYSKVIASGLFKGSNLSLLKHFHASEQAHVGVIRATVTKLGGTPSPMPTGRFPLTNAPAVLKLAATVENLGAAAYLGQAGAIQSKEVLAAALAIHTVEARHAATLNTLLKKDITPDGAFAQPASMAQVLAAVKPFLVA